VRGHVRKHGPSWQYQVRIGDAQRTKAGFATQREAEMALTTLLSTIHDGTYVTPAKLTTGTYLTDIWLPSIAATVQPTTYAGYKSHVERQLVPRLGSIPLQKVTAPKINAFYAELAKDGKVPRKKDEKPGERGGLASNTIRRVHATLSGAMNDAVRWGYLARNPAAMANPPKNATTEMHVWTATELQTFLEQTQGDRLWPLWVLLASTGLRRGEACGLQWSDVDLKAGCLAVRRALTTKGLSTPKTKSGDRVVSLDSFTVTTLKKWKKIQTEDRVKWGELWTNTGYVFTREDGNPYHPDVVSGAFESRVAKTKLPRIRLHDLRHTHATIALSAGTHPKVVSERLGHANAAFTMNTYVHVLPGMQDDAAEKIAALSRPRAAKLLPKAAK
jgi:integrase